MTAQGTEVDVELVLRVHTSDGECFEIGTDAEGGDMVEIRLRNSDGSLSPGNRISMPHEAWVEIRKHIPEARP